MARYAGMERCVNYLIETRRSKKALTFADWYMPDYLSCDRQVVLVDEFYRWLVAVQSCELISHTFDTAGYGRP